MQSSDKNGWTVVSYKKRKNKKNTSSNRQSLTPIFQNKQKPVLQHQNWDNVIIKGRNPQTSNNRSSQKNISVRKPNAGKNKQNKNTNVNINKLENIDLDEESTKPLIKTVNLNVQTKIKQQRAQLKMSQKDLAKKCNLPLSDIQSYENGKAIYDSEKLIKIGKALGISLSNKK